MLPTRVHSTYGAFTAPFLIATAFLVPRATLGAVACMVTISLQILSWQWGNLLAMHVLPDESVFPPERRARRAGDARDRPAARVGADPRQPRARPRPSPRPSPRARAPRRRRRRVVTAPAARDRDSTAASSRGARRRRALPRRSRTHRQLRRLERHLAARDGRGDRRARPPLGRRHRDGPQERRRLHDRRPLLFRQAAGRGAAWPSPSTPPRSRSA